MKLRTVLIDDEKYARENLRAELEPYSDVLELVGEANSVEQALELIDGERPELIFLDINLGDGTGFDVLEKVKHKEFKLVFLTAYNQYAIRAFKFNALDYLLKPLDKKELATVIEKVQRLIHQHQPLLEEILKNMEGLQSKKIAIPSQDGFSLHPIDEIIRCQSDGNYTLIYFNDKHKILSSKTLKYFDDLLTNSHFERVHNSHLVNLNHIKKYSNIDGGSLKMSDGSEVPISQRKKSHVLTVLERM